MSVIISDSDNFTIIDPNAKEIDVNGVKTIVPKAIEQEDLVIFCNLKSYPKNRSYILQSSDNQSEIVNVASGKFNLLKPNETKDKFTSDWTDINLQTGQLNGDEALGITSIDITYDTSYVPRVTINMTDVRGQALNSNEVGSPYKTFFSFPYPLFILEMKGFYGKLVKYVLHLKKYNSKYNYETGNFEITCEFVGFTFAVLSDLNVYLGLVAPQMVVQFSNDQTENGNDIINGIYDRQIKKETNKVKKEEIINIRNNCKTLYELIKKSKDLESFYSKFGLSSSNLMDTKSALDEYLEYLENFLLLIPKGDTSSVVLNTGKITLNNLNAVKKYYPQLELKVVNSTDTNLNNDKTNFIKSLNGLRDIAAKLYKDVDNKINDNLAKQVESFLGFKPTIENVFRIIANSFQTFLELLGKTSIAAASKPNRVNSYKIEKNKIVGISKDLESVYPWPYIWDNNNNIQYPGQNNNLTGGLTIGDYPEMAFVNAYISAQIKVNKILEDDVTNIGDVVSEDNFNPIHTIQFGGEKPYKSNKIIDILYQMLENSLLSSEYGLYDTVTNLGKSDAQNLIGSLGVVNKSYDILRQVKDIPTLIREIKTITGSKSDEEAVKKIKFNTIYNNLEPKIRVFKVNDSVISADSLNGIDRRFGVLESNLNYYGKIKDTSVSYLTTKDDNNVFGFPVIDYNVDYITNSDINLGFLNKVLSGELITTYFLGDKEIPKPTNNDVSLNPNFKTKDRISLKLINVDDINFLESSFSNFIERVSPSGVNFLTYRTGIPDDLFSQLFRVYHENIILNSKLYTTFFPFFNGGQNIYPASEFREFAKNNNSAYLETPLYVNRPLLSYNSEFDDIKKNYYSFLKETWVGFLVNILGLVENYINDGRLNDFIITRSDDKFLNLEKTFNEKDGDTGKKLYDYISNWLNSDVSIINANMGVQNIINDTYNVIFPDKNSIIKKVTIGNVDVNYYANAFISSFNKELSDVNSARRLDTSYDDKKANANKEELITDDNIKLSLYLSFKNINDKWIYTTKTNGTNNITYPFNLTGDIYTDKDNDLIDYFYFVDRGNRYIGDKFYVDISVLKNYLEKNNGNNSLYSLVGEILSKNEMNFHPLTSYISYIRNNIDDIFNTQLNTEEADSSPAFICQYVGKPATYQYDNENHYPDYLKFNFDTKTLNNGSIFNIGDNKSIDKEFLNRAVCFTVDTGILNQNVFKSIQLDQSEFRETQESLIVVDKLTSRDANRFSDTISNNLFNVYSRRSYTCKVECMGNMMIQPTMYFYLRYVPLFNGLYLITKVSHNLQGTNLITNFEGVRVPIFNFPIVDNFITTLSKNVYSNYKTNVLPSYNPDEKYYDNLDKNAKSNISIIYNKLKSLGLTNNISIAAILAVVSKESNFKPVREGSFYKTNDAIRDVFGGNTNYKKLADLGDEYITFLRETKTNGHSVMLLNYLYNGKNGNNSKTGKVEFKGQYFDNDVNSDGWKYRGGGFNQLTGRGNYTNYKLEDNPDALTNDLDTATDVLFKFNVNNVLHLKDIDNYNITSKTGLGALNELSDLDKAYDIMFNITAGPGFTLSESINKYGDSYKKGVINLLSLYNALKDDKIV